MEPINQNKAFAYLLVIPGAIALMIAFTGCNSHPSIIDARHFSDSPTQETAPNCNDTDGDDCPTCPVCGKKDHKHGHTNKGHHYAFGQHHANG